MILRFDSRFDSTSFGFKIRFEDSAESSNLSNLKIRESYDSTITGINVKSRRNLFNGKIMKIPRLKVLPNLSIYVKSSRKSLLKGKGG